MIKSYEMCPVCNRDMTHSKRLNQWSELLGKKLSYVESVCNYSNISDVGYELPNHLFFQITSLYGELYFEKIDFIHKGFSVELNYVAHSTKISYYPKPCQHFQDIQDAKPVAPDIVSIDNHLIELDYPTLEKTAKRIKNLTIFI